MNRPDQLAATEALRAYTLAGKPTESLTLGLVNAIAQLLANDQRDDIAVMIGRTAITRIPKAITLERRRA